MAGSRLSDAEWVHIAERLPVGQQVRVKHTCGRTPSLIIRRKVGALTAHCYRCKGWGKKVLEMRVHASLRYTEQPVQRQVPVEYTVPAEHQRLQMLQFLATKGIDACMVPANTMYSAKHNRVAFKVHDGLVLARTMQDAVPKWVQYQSYKAPGYAEITGIGCTVLTEDWLSALKVGYSTGYKVIALLGTSLSPEVELRLLEDAKPVLIMLDGDKAGRVGALAALKQLRFRGVPCSIVHIPEGTDPKDLQIQELRNLLNIQNYKHLWRYDDFSD